MISTITPSDLRLYTFGDYISVARGFNRTVQFSTTLPPTATPPADLVISGVSDINLATYNATATSTGVPSSESRTFFYEVVSPKVVYKLLSSGILFYDVSGVSTFPHPDVVTSNTAWIQNPGLLTGTTILLEEFNGTSWNLVTSFPIGGVTSIMEPWSGTKTFRTRLQKVQAGAVVFEAEGATFTLEFSTFVNGDLKLEYSEDEPLSGFLYQLENPQYLTVQPEKGYQIVVSSDGEGYQFEYVSSSINQLFSGFTYSSPSKTLTITDFDPLVGSITFSYVGVERQFLNGVLTNTANPVNKSIVMNTEVVVVVLDAQEQTSCTNTVVFEDGTEISSPAFVNRGQVFYEIQIANTWFPITSVPRGGSFSYSNCSLEPGTYFIRGRFVAREVPNCGGTSQIVFQTDWTQSTLTVLGFEPVFELPTPESCCLTVGEEQVVTPVQVQVNNELCEQDILTGGYEPEEYDAQYYATFSEPNQSLTYLLERYDITSTQWLPEDSESLTVVSDNVEAARYRFTPEILGKYRLTGTLQNCCKQVEQRIEFDVCDCLQITPKCKDLNKCSECNLYDFTNYCSESQTVIIKLARTQETVHEFVVNPSSVYTHRFTQDDLYQIEYSGKTALIPVYCTITECYNKLLKEQLCKTNTSGCCNDKELFNGRLATIQPIYQLFLNKLEKYNIAVGYRYTSIDVTNDLNDFQELDKIKEALLKYCELCRLNCPKCFEWSSGNCI